MSVPADKHRQTPRPLRSAWVRTVLRLRGTISWLVILAILGLVLTDVVQLGLLMSVHHLAFTRAVRATVTPIAIMWLLVLGLLVASCAYIRPILRHVRFLSRAAAVAASIVLGHDLLLVAANLATGGYFAAIALEIVGATFSMILKVIVVVFLWRLSKVAKMPDPISIMATGADMNSRHKGSAWRPVDKAAVDQLEKACDAGQQGNDHKDSRVSASAGGDWRSGMQGLSAAFTRPRPSVKVEPESSAESTSRNGTPPSVSWPQFSRQAVSMSQWPPAKARSNVAPTGGFADPKTQTKAPAKES